MYGSMMTSNKALLDSRDDIDEIDQLFSASVQPAIPIQQLPPSRPKSPPKVSHVPPVPAGLFSTPAPPVPVSTNPNGASSSSSSVPPAPPSSPSPSGFGSAPVHSTLTEPVWHTLRRDILRVASNVWTVVFPCFSGAQPGKALRDWDLWGPLFFIIFLALTLSSSASHNKSVVFAVVFAVLSSGAVVLTLNVILLGGKIIFFQSLSVLGYCLFPLDAGALICLGWSNKLFRSVVVLISLAWSSWSAYPFLSSAVPPARKALAVYPVFLLYVAVGFLVLAND